MILDSHSGLRGVFVVEGTSQVVRWVIWYDTDTHEYEAFRADPALTSRLGVSPSSLRYRAKQQLRFIPAKPVSRPKATDVKDAVASMREAKLLYAKPILMLPGQECDERFCHKLAEWQTAIERVIEPVIGEDGKSYKRGIVVDVRHWCSKHYRLPQRTSERGVESEVEVEARPK